MSQLVGLGIELRIGQRLALERDGDRFGILPDFILEQSGERRLERIARRGSIPAAQDLIPLRDRQKRDVIDAHVEVRQQAVQYPHVLIDEAHDRALFEKLAIVFGA